MKSEILYLVVPCYNEELVIEEATKKLSEKLDEMIKNKLISSKSKICFVDDGSRDKTWELIEKVSKTSNKVLGIKLAHNRGHQYALLSGLITVKDYADMVITIDADLQQDINALDRFVEEYYKGNDIVYGVRTSRKTDGFMKKLTSQIFYKLMTMFGCESIKNHADYRLTSKRVLNELANYKEVNLYLRGLFPHIGFKSSIIYFEVYDRFAGKSKYNFKKMLTLATDGITSFSVKPIRLVFSFGILLSLISLIISIIILFTTELGINIVLSCMFFVTGLIITSIGIVGEYVGKTYFEAKQRPNYCIEEFLNENIKYNIDVPRRIKKEELGRKIFCSFRKNMYFCMLL